MTAPPPVSEENHTELPIWTPQDGPQAEFYHSDVYEILYGGAAGGGKSSALVALPLPWIQHRDLRALILRRTTPQLEDLLDKAREIYKLGKEGKFAGADPDAEFRGDKNVWTFSSGARIKFGHCNDEDDWESYQGHEYPVILFDELTHFTERQYLEIAKRCRGTSPYLPRFIRATSNPGSEGHEWVFERWKYWLDPEAEISGRSARHDADTGKKLPPAAPGEVLWFYRDADGKEHIVEEGYPEARSRTFIPARLEDNPALLAEDPGYRQRLRDDSDPVRRKQLEEGDWLVKPAAGLYFKPEWFEVVDRPPVAVRRRTRYWDKAATEPHEKNKNPDWTVGVRLSHGYDDFFYVEDVERMRLSPGPRDARIKLIAALDGRETRIRSAKDPAQAGVTEAAAFIAMLTGYDVAVRPETGDKITRAGPVSSQCHPASTGGRTGRFRIVRGAWNKDFLASISQFPDGKKDDVDALSGAFEDMGFVADTPGRSGGTREFSDAGEDGPAMRALEKRFGSATARGGF